MPTNTFIKLTNRVLKAFNEVQLDSGNFLTATGFYQEAKDAVNQAIFDVYTREDTEWPFAWAEATLTTVAGTKLYTKNINATSIDWDSFRIRTDTPNNITAKSLGNLSYDVYRSEFLARDDGATSETYGKPTSVVRRSDNNIILTPVPDKAYTIVYEYFNLPIELELEDDTPLIPEQFNQVIIDKALHYAYMFRDNSEQAAIAEDRFEKSIHKMRRILIPQFDSVVPR